MGNEYLDFSELSKEAMSKSEDSGASVRKALYSDDENMNFVTKIGMNLRDNDYYINKYGHDNIETDNYYDDGEAIFENLMEELIEFDSSDERITETNKTTDEIKKELKAKKKEADKGKTRAEKKADKAAKKDPDDVMEDFQDAVNNNDCTTKAGMEKILVSIENNLNCALGLIKNNNKEKLNIKPSGIKELIHQFKLLKETEWDRPTKYIPKDDSNPYYKASRAIYRAQFFDAYENSVKDFLRKTPAEMEDIEEQIAKLISATLRPTVSPERHDSNTGKHAYHEIKAYAEISDKGYDDTYDERYGSSKIEISADFEFKQNEESNIILHRLLAVLLERVAVSLAKDKRDGILENYVNDVLKGNYKFEYEKEPIWRKEKANFNGKKIGAVESVFAKFEGETPIKEAYTAFDKAVYKEGGLATTSSLGREKTKILIEAFVDKNVAHYQDVLTFLGSTEINRDDAKYKKLFEKLKSETTTPEILN